MPWGWCYSEMQGVVVVAAALRLGGGRNSGDEASCHVTVGGTVLLVTLFESSK